MFMTLQWLFFLETDMKTDPPPQKKLQFITSCLKEISPCITLSFLVFFFRGGDNKSKRPLGAASSSPLPKKTKKATTKALDGDKCREVLYGSRERLNDCLQSFLQTLLPWNDDLIVPYLEQTNVQPKAWFPLIKGSVCRRATVVRLRGNSAWTIARGRLGVDHWSMQLLSLGFLLLFYWEVSFLRGCLLVLV